MDHFHFCNKRTDTKQIIMFQDNRCRFFDFGV